MSDPRSRRELVKTGCERPPWNAPATDEIDHRLHD